MPTRKRNKPLIFIGFFFVSTFAKKVFSGYNMSYFKTMPGALVKYLKNSKMRVKLSDVRQASSASL
jgi:hypothetical protein